MIALPPVLSINMFCITHQNHVAPITIELKVENNIINTIYQNNVK